MNKEIKILIIEASKFKVLLDYAIEGLRGKTHATHAQLADFLEKRIKDIELEIEQIKNTEYEHWNNPKGNKESTESHTEAVAGEI